MNTIGTDIRTGAEGTRLAVVRARDLSLSSGRESAFSGVSFDVHRGELFVLVADSGAGKTALALALSGRLTVSGSLSVLGNELPRHAGAVRHRVAFTGNPVVAPLDDTLTVEQHIAEAVVLNGPWWKPATSSREVADVVQRANTIIGGLGDAGTDRRIAPLVPDALVAAVQPLARLVLSVVLALLAEPEILVIDDVDLLRDARDRHLAWYTLAALTTPRLSGLTIIATCQAPAELRAATDQLDQSGQASAARPIVEFDLSGRGAATAPEPASSSDSVSPADSFSPTESPSPADSASTSDRAVEAQ